MSAIAAQPKRPDQRWVGTPPEQFALALRRSFAESERLPKFERDRTMFLCQLMYLGKQRVFLSRTGWYKEIRNKPEQPDLYHPENYFRVCLDGNVTQITQAQVEFEVRAARDSTKARAGARAEQAVADYYERMFFTESFRQDMAKRVQIQGLCGVYGWWDEEAGPTLKKPTYGQVTEKQGEDAFMCPSCGAQGPTSSLIKGSDLLPPDEAAEGEPPAHELAESPEEEQTEQLCPQCGLPDVQIQPAPVVTRVKQTGMLEYPAGDVAIEQVPGYELSFNSGARTTRTSGRTKFSNLFYLERERLIDRAAAEKLHPDKWDKFVTASGGFDYNTRGQHYQRRIERTYGGTENDRTGWTEVMDRRVEYREVWYHKDAYADYTASSDYELWEGGPMITAGQKLVDLYPDGLKVCMSGDNVLSMVGEDMTKRWRFVKIRQMPDQFWGGDFSDAVPLQILLNETNSLILSNGMNNEMPRALAYSPLIKNINTYAYPGNVMTYEQPPPNGLTSNDLFKQFPAAALAVPFYARPQELRTQIQSIFGGNFLGISGESGGAKLDTATSWSIAQSQAAAKGKTMFALIAEGYAGILEIILDLFAEHADEERLIELQGDYALNEVMAVKGEMLGKDLEIRVKAGSVVPRQDYQLRDDVMGAMEAEAQYTNTHGQPPPPVIAELIADRWNAPVVASDAMVGARVAQIRLDGYKEAAKNAPMLAQQQMAQQMQAAATMPVPDEAGGDEAKAMMLAQMGQQAEAAMQDPQQLALMAFQATQTDPSMAILQIRMMSDKHEAMIAWYESWLNKDDGITADPVTFNLIQKVMAAHYEAAAEKQAQIQGAMAMAQMQAQAPVVEAQMAQAAAAGMPHETPAGESGDKPKDFSPNQGPTADTGRERNAAKADSESGAPNPTNF